DVQLEANESAIMPGNPVTYRVDVTNLGNTTAHNVSVVVTIPTAMVVTSAAPEPTIRDGRLTWILNSVPVGSTWLFFTATLPPAKRHPDSFRGPGLRHRRRDALGDPDVRRDDDGSVHRAVAGDPIPRREHRLRDGGERDLGRAQC